MLPHVRDLLPALLLVLNACGETLTLSYDDVRFETLTVTAGAALQGSLVLKDVEDSELVSDCRQNPSGCKAGPLVLWAYLYLENIERPQTVYRNLAKVEFSAQAPLRPANNNRNGFSLEVPAGLISGRYKAHLFLATDVAPGRDEDLPYYANGIHRDPVIVK